MVDHLTVLHFDCIALTVVQLKKCQDLSDLELTEVSKTQVDLFVDNDVLQRIVLLGKTDFYRRWSNWKCYFIVWSLFSCAITLT